MTTIDRFKSRVDGSDVIRSGMLSLADSAKQVGHIEVYRAILSLPNGKRMLRETMDRMKEQGTLKA